MTPQGLELDDAETNDLARLLAFGRRLLRAWPLVLLCVSLAALGCFAFLSWRQPVYRSETVILYSHGVASTDPVEQAASPRNAGVRLKELLMSRPRLKQVITEFKLYPEIRERYGLGDAVDELKRDIEFRAPGGDTFSIAFRGTTPQQAQGVTRALASLVIDADADLRKTQAERSREFLVSEKAKRTGELKDAEQRLAEFMGQHRRFALDATPLTAGAAIRATVDDPNKAPNAGAPAPTWHAPRQHEGARAATAPGQKLDTGEWDRAEAALVAARQNLAEQLAHYTPAHPAVREAQREIEQATSRLQALGPRPEPPPPPAAPVPQRAPARAAASAQQSKQAATDPDEADVVGLETRWVKLTREVTEARRRLDQVEAALFKADVLASSERAGRAIQISVIDPAFLPDRPVGLSVMLLAAVFIAGGLLVGLIVAAMSAVLDDRIFRASDAGRAITVLAQVPRHRFRRSHATA